MARFFTWSESQPRVAKFHEIFLHHTFRYFKIKISHHSTQQTGGEGITPHMGRVSVRNKT